MSPHNKTKQWIVSLSRVCNVLFVLVVVNNGVTVNFLDKSNFIICIRRLDTVCSDFHLRGFAIWVSNTIIFYLYRPTVLFTWRSRAERPVFKTMHLKKKIARSGLNFKDIHAKNKIYKASAIVESDKCLVRINSWLV